MIEDYYRDLYFVDEERQPDGTGGFEYVYRIGEKFRGSATKSTTAEQQVAGIRGVVGEQYTITTAVGNVIKNSDIIMFIDDFGERVFVKVNSNPVRPPKKSKQRRWQYVTATNFEPDIEVL